MRKRYFCFSLFVIPFCQQQLYRRLYDCIPSFLDILARNGNRNVRIDSELRMPVSYTHLTLPTIA